MAELRAAPVTSRVLRQARRSSKGAALWELARPFTLIAPALGFLSGGLTALGARPPQPVDWAHLRFILVGSLMAAVLNAGSNVLNQVYDVDIDRINKPHRPLPSGRVSLRTAKVYAGVLLAVGLALAWWVQPLGRPECFILAATAVGMTWMYSAPPLRTKRLGIWANVTIAIPRGWLLKVAGWSSAKTIWGWEPWYIGTIFGLFLLGATSTKDFADIEGDRAFGCRTLPVRYGVRRAAQIISPFFIVPFLLIPIGVRAGILTGHPRLLDALSAVLVAYGSYVVYLMLRRPDELATDANHISWTHMYIMMVVAQVGFAVAYLVPRG